MESHLTIGQIAKKTGEPLWRVRIVVDSLPIDVHRAGLYRLVPAQYLPQVIDGLKRYPRRHSRRKQQTTTT